MFLCKIQQKPTAKTQHTCQQELFTSVRCNKCLFLIVQGDISPEWRMGAGMLSPATDCLITVHCKALEIFELNISLPQTWTWFWVISHFIPQLSYHPKYPPLPEKRTTRHLREKWHFIFVSSTQISGCITQWVGVKPQEVRKGKMLASWLWNNS